LLDTNDTSSYSIIDITDINNLNHDNDTYNFSLFEVKDVVDDRDFIFSKFGKNVYVNSNGYNLRDVIKYPTHDYYLSTNNTGSTTIIFTSSYDLIQSIGSGSGKLTNQITGSNSFKNLYSGSSGNGYSERHLSKFVRVGTRVKKQAVSGSFYKIINGIKLVSAGALTYYTYIKGRNDISTTVNRKGLPNGSSPIITIPGFLSVDIESDNFPKYGVLTGSVGDPNSLFVQLPLTCSTCASASMNNYIMNL
jgi:hypothetical protein